MRIEKAKLKDIIRKIRTESAISRLRLGIECNRAEKTIKNLETESDPRWSTVMAVASRRSQSLYWQACSEEERLIFRQIFDFIGF